MGDTLQVRISRLERIRAQQPHYAELLSFYEKLLIEKEHCKAALADARTPCPTSAASQAGFEKGFPLLGAEAFAPLPALLTEHFLTVLELVQDRQQEWVASAAKKIRSGELKLENLVKGVLHAEVPMTNLAGIDYLALEAIKPWLEFCASALLDTVRERTWSYEYCPVCGGSPMIGELSEEEGRRLLYCALCGTQWRHPRLQCVFCGEADHNKLSYLSVEQEIRNRLDVCKSCKRYIKIVDRRQVTEPVFPDLENIATLHLDMVAQSKGYQARPVYPPSLITL